MLTWRSQLKAYRTLNITFFLGWEIYLKYNYFSKHQQKSLTKPKHEKKVLVISFSVYCGQLSANFLTFLWSNTPRFPLGKITKALWCWAFNVHPFFWAFIYEKVGIIHLNKYFWQQVYYRDLFRIKEATPQGCGFVYQSISVY